MLEHIPLYNPCPHTETDYDEGTKMEYCLECKVVIKEWK